MTSKENYGSDYENKDYDDDYVLLTDNYLEVVDTHEPARSSSYFTSSLPNIKEEEEYELCDSSREDAKSFLKNESSSFNYPKIQFARLDNNRPSDIMPYTTTSSIVNAKSNGENYEFALSKNRQNKGSDAPNNWDLSKIEKINPDDSVVKMNKNDELSNYQMESLPIVKPSQSRNSTTDSHKSSFNTNIIKNKPILTVKHHPIMETTLGKYSCPENGSGDYSGNGIRQSGDSIKIENEQKKSGFLMPSSCIDFADSIHYKSDHTLKVPSEIFCLQEKLKYIYSQYFHKGLDPTPWLQFTNKPKVSCLVEGRVRRILSSSHFVGPPVTAMDLKLQLGKHLVLKGDTGSGKSTWLRRFAYQYGLSLLPYIDEEFDVVLYLHGDMFPVKFSGDFLDLSQFLSIILPANCIENEFRSFCVDWMLNNSHRILFLIDSSFQTFLFLKQLLKKEIFSQSTCFFTNCPLFDDTILTTKMEITYEIVPWSESDILKYLRHFSQAFNSDNEKTSFLECIEGLNCAPILSLPENCSLTCLLYYLDKELVKNSTITCRTDILDILFVYFIKQQFPQIDPNKTTNLPEGVIKILESAWNLIFKQTDETISIPIAETCTNTGVSNKISLSGWEFGEFLASKFIYFKWNELKKSQTNNDRSKRNFFLNCWSIVEQNLTSKTMSHAHKMSVFLCRLMGHEFTRFLDFVPHQFSSLPTIAKQRFNRILDDSIREISSTTPEIISHITNKKISDNPSTTLTYSSNSPPNDNTLNHKHLKASKHCEKEISFRGNGNEKRESFSIIEKQLEDIEICSQPDTLTLIFYMDDLSLENIQKACLVFEKPLKMLTTLNIALYFKASDQMHSQSSIPKINHVIKMFAEFLSKNQDLKSLGMWGGFLLPNTLSNLKENILHHPSLDSITIKGQLEMNNQRCLGRFDPYSGLVLSMILEKRHWKYICIDLRGFTSDGKSSLNFNRLARVVSNHNLDERLKGFSLYSMDSEPNLDQAHVASTSELSNIQSTSQGEQNLISQIIRPLRYHSTVASIILRCKSIGFALLDNLSDMIDASFRLKCLELEVEYIDEEFILSVGSGIVCANTLQYCTVIGKVFRRYASNAGKCITSLLQSCILSSSLRGIVIKISPLYEEDIDWLLISIPSLPNISRASITVVIESKVITTDPEKFEEKIKYLKYKTSHRNLDLDCHISAILESSF